MSSIIEASGLDTSDATATAAQILSGYTAYANGEKLTGSYVAPTGRKMEAYFMTTSDNRVIGLINNGTTVTTNRTTSENYFGQIMAWDGSNRRVSVLRRCTMVSITSGSSYMYSSGSATAGSTITLGTSGYYMMVILY